VELTDQRRGLGRLLVCEALEKCRARPPAVSEVTVNSSPNAGVVTSDMGSMPEMRPK